MVEIKENPTRPNTNNTEIQDNTSKKILLLIGATGSGKTTIAKELEDMKKARKIISYTTRPPREGEVDGIDYHFISREEFENLINNGEIFQYSYNEHNGFYYGDSKKEISTILEEGKIPVGIVDINGIKNFQEKLGEDYKIISIYLKPPSIRQLIRRVYKRDGTVNKELLNKTLKRIQEGIFSHIIQNHTVNQTTNRILKILQEN